jgi:hypothetical protein
MFAKKLVLMHENVMILALILQPRQGAWKGDSRECNLGVTFTLPRMQKNVREWVHTPPSGLSLWDLESQKTSEYLESDLKGQNSLDWKVPYAIGIFLIHRCLKWIHMIHLNIYNISYGRNKSRESKCQFDSQPLKVGNRPELHAWKVTHSQNPS